MGSLCKPNKLYYIYTGIFSWEPTQTQQFILYIHWYFFKGIHANQKNHALYTGVAFIVYTLVDISWKPTQTLGVTLSNHW